MGSDINFDISIEEPAEACPVITVRGEVDLHTAPKVQYALESVAEGASAVVVDMSGIEFMDSTALSMFARSKDALEKRNVSLRFAAPSPAVERIFTVTGFRGYFDIFTSREDAIPSR